MSCLRPAAGIALVTLGCLGATPGCRSGSDTAATEESRVPRSGGTAVLGSISDVDAWNEYLSAQTFAGNLHRRMFLRLARETGESPEHPSGYAPDLAASWERSPDGRALTFHLREAWWSDGRPITAADVRFTWRAQTSAEVGWVGASSKAHVTDVEVMDPNTVVFHFDRDHPWQLADAVEGGILPAHVHGQVPFDRWRTHDWSGVTVGSGPFLLARHRPGEEIVLARNPRYLQAGRPYLDRVVVRIVPDVGSLLTQLLAGALDYVEGIPPRDAQRVRDLPGATLVAFDYPMYDYIGWNGSRPPFDDPSVRRALTLAIDRQALVDELLLGHGRVSAGPLLSFWWGADRTLAPWPFDPEEALRILEARGFRRGPRGVLARNGKPLAFTLTTNLGNRVREEALVKIQAQLARIGVRADPQPLEMAAFRSRNESGEYDAYLGGWRFSGRIELGSIFGWSATPPRGQNVVFYRSPEVDRLLDALDAAPDRKSMKPLLDAVQRAVHRDQPYTFLYESRRLVAVGPRLHGVAIDTPADPLAHLEHDWISE